MSSLVLQRDYLKVPTSNGLFTSETPMFSGVGHGMVADIRASRDMCQTTSQAGECRHYCGPSWHSFSIRRLACLARPVRMLRISSLFRESIRDRIKMKSDKFHDR